MKENWNWSKGTAFDFGGASNLSFVLQRLRSWGRKRVLGFGIRKIIQGHFWPFKVLYKFFFFQTYIFSKIYTIEECSVRSGFWLLVVFISNGDVFVKHVVEGNRSSFSHQACKIFNLSILCESYKVACFS